MVAPAIAGGGWLLLCACHEGRAGEAAGSDARTGASEEVVVVLETPDSEPIEVVTIDNHLGDIRIEGHDAKALVIHAYKRAPDDAALDQLRVSLVRAPGGRVLITAADRRAEMNELLGSPVRIELVVRAPRRAAVDVRIGEGGQVSRNADAPAGETVRSRDTCRTQRSTSPWPAAIAAIAVLTVMVGVTAMARSHRSRKDTDLLERR